MMRFKQRAQERGWFERPQDMPPVLHRLLIQRGLDSAEAAEAYLRPDASQLHDPMLLNDMGRALPLIRAAVAAGDPICVYGDYDVDGICASTILYEYLTGAGASVEVYLPSRHDEGYGLNEAAIRSIAERAKLLITVDCGIKSVELIELAKSLGMRCVVTDHHEPAERIPDCPAIDPLLGDYPFRWLCGAGVAFKLVSALAGREEAMRWIDLAAIATVADIVSLTGENRVIVRLGIERIRRAFGKGGEPELRRGLAALLECAGIDPGALTSEKIAFGVAPRLNAAGRLGSAMRGFQLLTARDEFLAAALADELNMENNRRKDLQERTLAEAEAQLAQLDFAAHRILLVRGDGWNSGIIGQVAGALREKYNYPAIAFSEKDGLLTGSCRSIEAVDINQTLCACADLMVRFGGHRQAAGLTVRAENFDALWRRLDEYLFANIPGEAYLPSREYDLEVPLDQLSEELVRMLGALEPTGKGNATPVFRTRAHVIEANAVGKQGADLQLYLSENGVRRKGIFFKAGPRVGELGEAMDILYTPSLNPWKGRNYVEVQLSGMRNLDDETRIAAARAQEGTMQRRFLTELLYNRRESCSAAAPDMELGELRERLDASIQGTFILCAGLDVARDLLKELEPLPLELCVGDVPADARGFNALAVWPQRLGEYPRALRTLVLAGLPAPDEAPPGVELRSLRVKSGLRGELPDLDRMRAVYVAARELSRRPIRIPDLEALDARLGEEAGLSPTCCHASLLALVDLKLVELREKPFGFAVPRRGKTDPQSSAVWRAIECLGKHVGSN